MDDQITNYSSNVSYPDQVTIPLVDSTEPSDDYSSTVLFVAVHWVVPTIVAFGLIGNILTLVVLQCKDFRRQVAYTYIRWMAVSDLLVMILMIPQIISSTKDAFSYYEAWYHSHLHLLLVNACLATSALFTVTLSAERCLAVWSAVKHKEMSTPGKAVMVVVFTYIICILSNIYIWWVFKVTPMNNTTASATSNVAITNLTMVSNLTSPEMPPEMDLFIMEMSVYTLSTTYQAMQLLTSILLKLVPVLLVVGLNSAILYKYGQVKQRRKLMQGGKRQLSIAQSAQAARRKSSDKRVTIMLLCVVVIFVVCVTPSAFQHVFFTKHNLESTGFKVFGIVADVLEITNSAANFYVYILWSSDFRQHFCEMLCPCRRYVYGRLCPCRSRARTAEAEDGQVVNQRNLVPDELLKQQHVTRNNIEYHELKQASPGPEGAAAEEEEEEEVVELQEMEVVQLETENPGENDLNNKHNYHEPSHCS